MSRSRRRNATPPSKPVRWALVLPTAFLVLAGLGAFAAVAYNTALNARLDFDETIYVIKAWWYITGTVTPFGTADSAPVMPVYPYALGAAQTFMGLAAITARWAMVGLGLVNGLLIYLLCRKLTANTLASAAAAAVFLATPATAFSFATATPVALIAFLHIVALWLLVASVGRPALSRTLAMGVVLALLTLTSGDMLIPAVLLALMFIAANGGARLVQGFVLVVTIVLVIGGAVYALPDQFGAYLLAQPVPHLLLGLLGMAPPGPSLLADETAARIIGDLIEGTLLPYGGLIILSILLLGQTLRGPRVLWFVPLYFIAALIAVAVFRTSACEACAATAPSQVTAMGAVAAALAFGFLQRWRRQQGGTGTPLVVIATLLALALNTFAPVMAERPALHSFPAEMLRQTRPAAEQQEVTALMRVIAENVPGNERVLLLHRLPGLPYAMHMAGRRFPAASLNPMASLRLLPAGLSSAQREATLAAIERSGGWSGETVRRWIERDYDVIVMQDGVLNLDATTLELLATRFEIAATPEFRGAKLTFYKRKS